MGYYSLFNFSRDEKEGKETDCTSRRGNDPDEIESEMTSTDEKGAEHCNGVAGDGGKKVLEYRADEEEKVQRDGSLMKKYVHRIVEKMFHHYSPKNQKQG